MSANVSLTASTALPSPTTLVDDPVPAHHANPVVAFIIGLSIVLLASILNAAGLNITKVDHVRTSAIPKASRRRDWLRPLWLLGMILYILSQLIGSTLALEYMRAEYVAPLGATSLIFNFLFARFLVGTPVTNNDIYGTIIVILGVIGIVAFGSINSGLAQETDIHRLAYLWSRGNWLAYFFFMSFALIALVIFTSSLDAVLAARSDLSAEPFAGMSTRRPVEISSATGFFGKTMAYRNRAMLWVKERLEVWTAPKDDKLIAWTLGIGWACCGGGLAGGCLVFAKATVKLASGSLSHENTGNQFGHPAAIFTMIILAVTAVSQIICLNRGLKVYDSTLVVPVFYGVYTALGFLDSLIFNDSVDAYQNWALFFIFASIVVLISGVVLLTHKKPEAGATHRAQVGSVPSRKRANKAKAGDGDSEEEEALRTTEEGEGEDNHVMWQIGDASDDEDEQNAGGSGSNVREPTASRGVGSAYPERREGVGLMKDVDHGQEGAGDEEAEHDVQRTGRHRHRRSASSEATIAVFTPQGGGDAEEFGEWKDG
ncbi:hypothetical protein PUNSTDRAFT_119034 [Punctularia strigosozonata HHB-11173 SS5]|uniref:uncharacterized protein n=1 Tax=Punctularia strigosozonata (strain HHB-11173) TaxID=741275 RepID=UPI00044168D1|nr:uncharacterized protein PUNSTDRAFT_119034 [Punctularia strigosozonata HHB-11173 SS5]EIN11788.1 hypothetical protein PUNSTDRAFT_119034 [Punctularia strigosozonata HHB-11173 SS5]